MEFDHLTVTLLVLRPDAPKLDEEAAAALQDAHMAHLADLHESGQLLAAGPLADEKFRGLSILRVDVDEGSAVEGGRSRGSGRAVLGQGDSVDSPGRCDVVHADPFPALRSPKPAPAQSPSRQ